MATLPELLEALKNQQATGFPDTMLTDIEVAYRADIEGISNGAAATVAEAAAEAAKAQATAQQMAEQNQALQAKNYQLLTGGPAAGGQTSINDEPVVEEPKDDDPDGINLRLSDVLKRK